MADLTNLEDNQMKREVSVFKALGLTEAQLLGVGILFNLPRNSFVSKVDIYISTVSTTANSTMDVLVGGVELASEMPVTVAGVSVPPAVLAAARKYANGGAVTVAGAGVPPAAGDLVFDVIIEYIELDRHTGAFTD